MSEPLFHGTSSLYIPYLLSHGLSGRYPKKLYFRLKRLRKLFQTLGLLDGIESKQSKDYIDKFFKRQERSYKNGNIQISLTTRLDTAKEYIQTSRYNRRIGGEGISFLLDILKQNWGRIKESELSPQNIDDIKFITSFFSQQQTGVILVFLKDELTSLLPDNCTTESQCLTKVEFERQFEKKQDEIFFDNSIPSDFIYIYSTPHFSPLRMYESLSLDSSAFIDHELSIILKEVEEIEVRHSRLSNTIDNNIFYNTLPIIQNSSSGGKTNKKHTKSRRVRRKANTRRGRV
jgi:hypothetical protein